jgi:hypothetical protein
VPEPEAQGLGRIRHPGHPSSHGGVIERQWW